MRSTSAKTVREYAVELPGAVELFEELGLDYCCGGNVELDRACARAGLAFEPVLNHLEALRTDLKHAAPLVGWTSAPLPELIDYILATHHDYTRKALRRIPALLDKVAAAHGEAHPEVREVRALFRLLADDLDLHLQKEEAVLFPYICDLVRAVSGGGASPHACFPTVAFPIQAKETEHDTAGLLLRRMRAASGDYLPPADACPTFIEAYRALLALETDLHRHIHLENNVLHPRSLALEKEFREMAGSHSVS